MKEKRALEDRINELEYNIEGAEGERELEQCKEDLRHLEQERRDNQKNIRTKTNEPSRVIAQKVQSTPGKNKRRRKSNLTTVRNKRKNH